LSAQRDALEVSQTSPSGYIKSGNDCDLTRAEAAVIKVAHPPTEGRPEELRRWAREQTDRGRSEQSTALELGWTVNDVRCAIAERLRPHRPVRQ
jgi:hypothetical protein